jgi:hypothetical protein
MATSTRKLFPVLFALAILVGAPGVGSASLILNGPITNTPLFFQASVLWQNPSSFDTLDLSPTNTPWDVSLTASGFAGFALIVAQHAVAPDPSDVPFGANLQILFNGVTPGVGGGTQSFTGAHPAEHFDKLTVTITPDVPGQSSMIDITAEHQFIPEPGTLGLGVIGASLLLFRRRRSARS